MSLKWKAGGSQARGLRAKFLRANSPGGTRVHRSSIPTRSPPPAQRHDLPSNFASMSAHPSNTFSWRHSDDRPYSERTSPAENMRVGGSDERLPLTSSSAPPTNSPLHRQITPQGVLVTSDRTDDDTVPVVEGRVLSSPGLPPINDSPSQTMAKMMNDASLEPAIWISLASSVQERPVEKGWYIGESNIPDDSPEGFTVTWAKLTSQDIIEDAFLSPNQKSVMVYGQTQNDDIKINFEKFYAKRRGGVSRRPVIRIGSAADPGYSNDMLNGLGVWEFNYEDEKNNVTDWEKFDRSDCEMFDLCAQTGRQQCVIYDGNSAIAVTLFPSMEENEIGWTNILWRENCGVEKSKGYLRRREVGEEGQDDRWALGVESGGVPTSTSVVAAVTTTARLRDDDDEGEVVVASAVDAVAGSGEELSRKLASLLEMGFAEEKCLQALFDTRMNLDGAIERLLTQAT